MRILIRLPRETQSKPPFKRAESGTLTVLEGDKVFLGPLPVLGKGNKKKTNPSANYLEKGMDTPPGEYLGTITYGWQPESSYGPFAVIKLEPIGGKALEAKKNGRGGLAIHGGGDPTQQVLFSTDGCTRTFNRHQKQLIDLLERRGFNKDTPITIEEF